MLARRFEKYDNFLIDLDGTVWKWTKLIPGAIRLFQILKHEKKNVYFFTNNTALSRASFAKKLNNLGITAKESQILNPTLVVLDLLKGKKVFVSGEGIITDMRKAKIKVVSTKPDAVLLTEDRYVDYNKMSKAADFVRKGAAFYKTAGGREWLHGDKILLGVGSIAKAIEFSADKEAILLGKPSDYMTKKVKELKLNPKKTLVIGDDLDSEIMLGNKLGFDTALVLTGSCTKKDYKKARGLSVPKYLLNSIADIIA